MRGVHGAGSSPFGLDKELYESRNIKTVVVDNLTAIQYMALQKAVGDGIGRSKVFEPSMQSPGIPAYGGRNQNLIGLVRSLITVTAKHRVNIIFTAHVTTPELEKWWNAEEINFRKTKTVYNALGRRFRVIQRIDDEVLKSIVAFYPQSTIGDKITRVWYQSESDDKWPDDARVAIDVHDNLVCIASPRTIKTALAIMIKYAEEPIPVRNIFTNRTEQLIIPAEAKMSYPVSYVLKDDATWDYVEDPKGVHRWSHLKKVKL